MSNFTIYLGAISPAVMRQATQAAPDIQFGATWGPAKMTPHDWPYILDNGVWAAHRDGTEWSADAWLDTLDDVRDRMPRLPDFVVLPDVVGDADASLDRTRRWRGRVPDDWPTALALQDGMNIPDAVAEAAAMDCTAVFVGGTSGWKWSVVADVVDEAQDYGLATHIARPGVPEGLLRARNIGADSLDTTSIAKSQSYHHLDWLAHQQTFTEVRP